jgi:integrase
MQEDKDIVRQTTGPFALERQLVDAVDRVIAAAESPNTRRAYAAQLKKFEAWCERLGVAVLPAPPAMVATYLVDLAETGAHPTGSQKRRKVATVALALSAIADAHRHRGDEFNTCAPELRTALKGIRRAYAQPVAQAAALMPKMIRAILYELEDTPIDRRDGALIALLFAGALRRSEISCLDYAEVGTGDGYLALTSEAVEIVLLRSKARTEPVTVKIPRADNPLLVAALEHWIAIAGIGTGEALFRSIKKGGHIRGRLADGGVCLALKARIASYLRGCGWPREAAEAEAKKYSGHSGRVGMYTAASEAGVPIEAVAALARHKSLNVAQKYARHADQLRRAPSRNPTIAI